ncbi:hypothetical protein DFP72DRAFT_854356 [Ephemerocybe angulata]|uniref:Uncharacterized protein n=1 Tax=Ephemerocybe angulata TaxID=980116 RepID=A0A8H6M0A5_9AGAR|nr:hypothetical protein DFP72DRAFT_854356 [Tulosesus angulatus]
MEHWRTRKLLMTGPECHRPDPRSSLSRLAVLSLASWQQPQFATRDRGPHPSVPALFCRHWGRTVSTFCPIFGLVRDGMERKQRLGDDLEAYEDQVDAREARDHRLYRQLFLLVPKLEERLGHFPLFLYQDFKYPGDAKVWDGLFKSRLLVNATRMFINYLLLLQASKLTITESVPLNHLLPSFTFRFVFGKSEGIRHSGRKGINLRHLPTLIPCRSPLDTAVIQARAALARCAFA